MLYSLGKFFLLAMLMGTTAYAQINLEPKFGGKPETTEQAAADERFVASLKAQFQGDLRAASLEASKRGGTICAMGNWIWLCVGSTKHGFLLLTT
mgnify:FL=1